MPLFDYKCRACGTVRELRTKGEQEIFESCWECGMQTYQKKELSAPLGFILKGPGFYKPSASK